MPSRYQRIPDSGHPTTEMFAEQLFVQSREEGVWERITAEQREVYREKALRFMLGDLSVMTHAENPLRVRG